MRDVVVRAAILQACLSASCATTAVAPTFSDAQWLTVGVDPEVEARKILQDYEQAGYSLHARVVGQAFTAMGFVRADGTSRGIRVVTARGVALALDSVPKGALEDRLEYFLMMPPVAATLDADGDGAEEFFVRELGRRTGNCVVPYRVGPSGVVQRIEPDLARFGADSCIESLSDVDGNGEVELVVRYRIERLPLRQWPEVPLLLFPDGQGGFDPTGAPTVTEPYYVGEIERRQVALVEAADAGQAESTYRLACEVALLWHLTGAARATELRVLKSHFSELNAANRDRAIESAIVARAQEGW